MNKKTVSIILLLFGVAAVGIGVAVFFVIQQTPKDLMPKGAVITSTNECTRLGVEILERGGSAVDSAVAACLCIGVTSPQQSGLGGGMIATVFIKETGVIETIRSREVAPSGATKDMYDDENKSLFGGLAVAVPGELKGLHELHKKYGKLSWKDVVEPVAMIAENGFKVSRYLSDALKDRSVRVKGNAVLSDIFINKQTNEFYQQGEVVKNLRLARTLKTIAEEGADSFYSETGSLRQTIIDDITREGGIVQSDDLTKFQPKWGTTNKSKLPNNQTVHTFPLPTSGNIINFMLNVFNEYDYNSTEDISVYHVMMEIFKFGFGKRTKLGDEDSDGVQQALREMESLDYAKSIHDLINFDRTFDDPEHYFANNLLRGDHGTSQISILAPNGDAVSMTTTVNFIFGSYVVSDALGIVYNNEMNDFSIPAESGGLLPAPANFIAPGKSPMSSMSPIIVLDDKNEVQLVLGGAGGLFIMTSIFQFLVHYLYLRQSLNTSVVQKRLHHQLQPNRVDYENGYDHEDILDFLRSKGHEVFERAPNVSGFASLQVISRRDGKIEAMVDDLRRDEKHGFLI